MSPSRVVAHALALLVVTSGAARASSFTVDPLVPVSGPDVFASCTADAVSTQPGTVFPGSVVEPWVAVNPTNPLNIVAGWQQDRWSNGGSRGLVAGVSLDGGATFTQVVPPKVNLCSGGTVANRGDFQRSTDPWLTFAPNGDLYFFTLSLDIAPPPGRSGGFGKNAVFVSKSSDGGTTWDDPIQLIEDDDPRFLNDKTSITADPTDSRFVYAMWDRLKSSLGTIINPDRVVGFGFQGPAMLSRTTNGGATWEAARAIFDPGANNQTLGNQIVVLPDGTLIDLFDLILNHKNPGGQHYGVFNVALVRSTDRGETWTNGQAILVSPLLSKATFDPGGVGIRDPDTGAPLRTGDIIPAVAVDRNPGSPGFGNLYAVWQDARFSNGGNFSDLSKLIDEIAFSRSTDGGFTWSAPVKINATPTDIPLGDRQAFTAAVAVAEDGTVGVTYYDFRNNTTAPGLPTDYFIVHCHPSATVACTGSSDWGSEARITSASFDMEQAPVSRGYFTGDYQGLAVIGNQFRPVFVEAGRAAGTSAAFTTRAGP